MINGVGVVASATFSAGVKIDDIILVVGDNQEEYCREEIVEKFHITKVRKIVKGGADKSNSHEVDAITGGTKTSEGVTNMIKECLNYYKPYFDAKRQLMAEASTEVAVEGESNQINTDNNGK